MQGRSRWIRVLNMSALVLAVAFVAILASAGYLYALSGTLPEFETAAGYLRVARTSIVYAADGSVLAEWHGEQDRKMLRLEDIPRSVRDAVIAAEDEGFNRRRNVDGAAILTALRGDGGRVKSTITTQLVRMLLDERGSPGLAMKIRKALMVNRIEAETSKKRVLEAYLNMVYFGNGRYGVESASQGYFGKPASELTLAESALLAGVIRSPGRLAPTVDPRAARERRDLVLTRMRDLELITSEQDVAARDEEVVLDTSPAGAPDVAPYFVEYVKQQLINRLGTRAVFAGGLRIHTTLNPAMQRASEQAVASILTSKGDPEAAVVAVDPRDGRILAMVGGRDFAKARYNLAVQGRRQPGSAFKPFVLVAALEGGVSPDRKFDTSSYVVRVKDGYWRVDNYENGFTKGTLTLRAATDWSVNAVFARLVMEVGPEKVVDAARRMGITSPLEPNPAIALGGLSQGVSPLEMASAYGTLATGGMHSAPFAVLEVTDDRGTSLYRSERSTKRVVAQGVAAQVSGMLREVVERGTGMRARIGRPSAGKTGTTQSYRDAWFVGYTGSISAAVWVGFREGQVDMANVRGIKVTGGSFPAMIWSRFVGSPLMVAAAPSNIPVSARVGGAAPVPESSIVAVRICLETFLLANPRCPDVTEVDLEPALVPARTCSKH